MPQVGVYSECGERIMQSACVSKHDNPSQQTVAHEECENSKAGVFVPQPRICEENIHGNAAELERKIPPVVAPASKGECQGKLLPYLAGQHDDTAEKEENV